MEEQLIGIMILWRKIHFDIIGLSKGKIAGLDGFGGQNIIIDFENNCN